MVRTERFAWFDNHRQYHEVLQVWARIPATDVWVMISVEPIEIAPDRTPACPTP